MPYVTDAHNFMQIRSTSFESYPAKRVMVITESYQRLAWPTAAEATES